MTRALLIGKEPAAELGYDYVMEAPYDAVVIGSLTLSQLLRFREERVLSALAEGKPVYLYTPGLPEAPPICYDTLKETGGHQYEQM